MKKEVITMLNRWNTKVEDLNLILSKLNEIAKRVIKREKKRGRKPKHSMVKYTVLIVLKEASKKTLRGAEVEWSKKVCGVRVDHSVIAYWENKKEILSAVKKIISIAGTMLDKYLPSLFSFVDSTKFVSLNVNEVEFTLCNRIANGTVYPVGISFETNSVRAPVEEAVPEGNGKLYADAWYDNEKAIKVLFEKGYIPIICPNKNRWRGHYRKKARKLYRLRENRLGYRQRGRGESLFGSLTNKYGDRFTAKNGIAMKIRIASRVITYQIRLLIRLTEKMGLILRHAPLQKFFKNF